MHEFGAEPGESSSDEGNASETSSRQHKRAVLHDVLHVFDVRSRLHVGRSLALAALRLFDEEQEDDGDKGEHGGDSQSPVPRSEELCCLRSDNVTTKKSGNQ